MEEKAKLAINVNGSFVVLEDGQPQLGRTCQSTFLNRMNEQRLTEAGVPQSRVIAHSKARNSVTVVPATKHHVADHPVFKASDKIAITTGLRPDAQFTSKLTGEWMRMEKTHR